jgi:hypothetical protein
MARQPGLAVPASRPCPGAAPPPGVPALGAPAMPVPVVARPWRAAGAWPWQPWRVAVARPAPSPRRGALAPARPRHALPLALARLGGLLARPARGGPAWLSAWRSARPRPSPARPRWRSPSPGPRRDPCSARCPRRARRTYGSRPWRSARRPRLARPYAARPRPGAASARAAVVPLRSAARAQLSPGACPTRSRRVSAALRVRAHGALAWLAVPSARRVAPCHVRDALVYPLDVPVYPPCVIHA